MKKYNIAVSILTIFIGIGMIYFTKDFDFNGLKDIGPGFWPKLLGSIMILLSGILLIQTLIAENETVKIDIRSIGMKRVFLMVLIMGLFSFMLYFFGMMIAIIFLIPATIAVLGDTRKIRIIIITVGISAFVYIVFELLLNVGLPSGKIF